MKKGAIFTKDHREKLSKARKGKSPSNGIKTQFKKGIVGMWTGKKLSPEHRTKVIRYLTPFQKGHEYFPRREAI